MRYTAMMIACVAAGWAITPAGADMRRLPVAEYLDKVRGAWAGQMIGVSYGAPTEFKSVGRIIEGELPPWTPDRIAGAIGQDDVYVELTFLKALEIHGLEVTGPQAGSVFAASEFDLWHANRAGRENIRGGTEPPWSGHPRYNRHADDIDFQIESDLFGIIAPGLPRASNRVCQVFGHLMNYGDGVYGGMFVAGMYSAAFFDRSPESVVRAGLACVHPESKYARVIRDVLESFRNDPKDWEACWWKIDQKWGDDDYCPSGYQKPFNIDAKVNGAYVAIGLLYGQGDFEKTIDIATRCGQDSDCNPSSAGGILGAMVGYRGIPQRFTAGIAEIADRKFEHTDYSYNDLADRCLALAAEIVEREGGMVVREGESRYLLIPPQSPEHPPVLEQFTEEMFRRYWLEPEKDAAE